MMIDKGYTDFLETILQSAAKPPLFERGEYHFWDHPHIARSMLEAHLNPTHDAASRRPETIDKEVKNLISSGTLKKGDKILDLGCGPGLYANRLAEKGMIVTGVDVSESSLNYAEAQAKQKGLKVDYMWGDFFDIMFTAEFDVVMQIYGEIGTFSDASRDELLRIIHKALKPGGILVFDVTAPSPKTKERPPNSWNIASGGFWRPGLHLVLEQHFDYPEDNARVDQSIIVDDDGISVYRTWIHDYTLDSIKPVLEKAGFQIEHVWNDLTGMPYQAGGDWMAIVARKG